MTRVYYRFKGVPDDRPGGPWWHRDFANWREAVDYVRPLAPFAASIQYLQGYTLPKHDDAAVELPHEAKELRFTTAGDGQ